MGGGAILPTNYIMFNYLFCFEMHTKFLSYYLGTTPDFIYGHPSGSKPHEPEDVHPVLLVPLDILFIPSAVESPVAGLNNPLSQ